MERIQSSNLRDIKNIQHGFFTRNGGVSSGSYASANFSLRGHESIENIKENHKTLLKEFSGKFSKTIILSQKHTNKIINVGNDWDCGSGKVVEGDALITSRKGILVGILTADCVPLLLSNKAGTQVGAVHAGWRGVLSGIIENATREMLKTTAASEIVAALGPCLQQHNFEVQADFVSAFQQKYMSSRGFFLRKENKIYFNLEGFIRFLLQGLGVYNVKLLHLDTYSQPKQFFSYRRSFHRDEGEYGCQINVIGIP